MGPTLPKPGPTLLRQVATALHEVVISSVKRVMSKLPSRKIMIYRIANPIIPVMMSGCTLLPLYLVVMMPLGWMILFNSANEFLNRS